MLVWFIMFVYYVCLLLYHYVVNKDEYILPSYVVSVETVNCFKTRFNGLWLN